VRISDFVTTPETYLAVQAVRRLAAALKAEKPPVTGNPLVLHGPPGSGKSHLATGLVEAVTAEGTTRTARVHSAADFATEPPDETLACDLLVIEDLQHLPAKAADPLVRLIDYRLARRLAIVVTATAGPGTLPGLTPRLASRLSGGLVVGLAPLSPAGRRAVIARLAKQKSFRVGADVLNWIADRTPGGIRPLVGALATLESLCRGRATPPDLPTVMAHWQSPNVAPTPERVAKAVARHFRLDVRELRTRRRQPAGLWPCHVAIYLTRELTGLPWPRIGAAFGGRDSATLRHACKKVAERADSDTGFAAELRRITAEFVRPM
jgi:chromosomal replication initiator protein